MTMTMTVANARRIPLYQGYIFDLDGTLIDSSGDIAGAINQARSNLGLTALSKEAVLPMIGNGLPTLVERAFADSDIPYSQDLLDLVRRCYLEDPCSSTVIYPGVMATLEVLSSRPLAIISNKPSELMKPTLTQLGLLHFFDLAIGGEDFPQKKPHPEAALHILARWQLSPREVLMVGDMHPDRDLARNAGLRFAHCRYGFLNEALEADHTLHSFQELLT